MIVKRSITIRGHRTSISVEDAFWTRLQAVATERSMSIAALVAAIDARRPTDTNLSSAIRLFVLDEALSHDAGNQSAGNEGAGSDAAASEDAAGVKNPADC